MSTPGAIPKATRSERESYSIPNSLLVFVSLATRPSRPSRTAEMSMAMAALSNLPSRQAMIE